MPMSEPDLRAKIDRRIKRLETCSHELCSSHEACAEGLEARHLRQLLCEHPRWKQYDGAVNAWVSVDRPTTPCGRYCADCGLSDAEAEV